MAFIPIDAKADVQGSKKGKLTPAQHAQLNAWSLASKTGILDALGRCEAESLTYTATNNIATIVFKKGYLVICGRLVECEAGTEVQVNTPASPSGSTSGKIIARYNLGQSQEKEFEILTKQSGALVQQDLNENPSTGVYEFELYSYTATPNLVTLSRTGDYIPDIGGRLELFEKSLTDEGKPLGGYDTSKGTIEERLTALGFKEGSVTVAGGLGVIATQTNTVKRQGNYCILNIAINIQEQNKPSYLGVIPEQFCPETNTAVKCTMMTKVHWTKSIGGTIITMNDTIPVTVDAIIGADGNIYLGEIDVPTDLASNKVSKIEFNNVGYIAKPIK